jgi:peptide/nickel transport system substrate-binding protein
MTSTTIDQLTRQLKDGSIDRRTIFRAAVATGLTPAAAAAMAGRVAAQDASPAASPAGTGEVIQSMTRAEYEALIAESFDWEEPTSQGGQLVHTMTTDISMVNPVLATDLYSLWIGNQFIFDPLVEASVVDGSPAPRLADSWEIAEDGVTYTVRLQQSVTWHDGEPFTADDVIFTFDAALAEDSLSPRKSTIEEALESYRKIDDHTVEFTAKFQSAIFENDVLAQFGILPKHIWEDVAPPDWAGDTGTTGQDPARVIGTGPFRFVEWTQGSNVTLERNDDYWSEMFTPVIDTYTYQVITDPSSNIAALQTGQSDFTEVQFGLARSLRESNPELNIIDYDTTSINYFVANQDPEKNLPFTDVRVRQALLYALDRGVIADTVFDGFAVRGDGTQPVVSPAYVPDRINTIYMYDPAKAAELLDEAGWTPGADGIREKDGERLSFEMYYSEGYAPYEVQVPYMQQAWRESGIEMIPAIIPFPTLLENTLAGNFEMTLWGFSFRADGDQSAMFACNMVPPAGFNTMYYCSEEYDALVEPSKAALDPEERVDILVEMSNIANDDAAVGITVFLKNVYGAGPRLHNVFPNAYSIVWWINKTWIDEA